MKVILAEQYGMIYTIWLPDAVEGRYRFHSKAGTDSGLPVYVEGMDGEWVAHTEDGAVFRSPEKQISSRKILCDKMIEIIQHEQTEYVLFVEEERAGNAGFLFYRIEKQPEYTIGRLPDNQIIYPHRAVSRHHASLRWNDGSWYIVDNKSANGTYLNGRRVNAARLKNGDSVFIMGLYILIGPRFIALNNADGRVRINTPNIQWISNYENLTYPAYKGAEAEEGLFDRQPHKKLALNTEAIEIEMPPMPLYANKVPLLLRMGSPMVMGGRALVTGNLTMALTSLIFPAMIQGITEKDRKEYEEKRTKIYRNYLADKKRDILCEKQMEEQLLNESYPDLEGVFHFALTKKRLWERRKTDDDFLFVRIGFGRFPMVVKKEYEERKLELEKDQLAEEMYALAESPVYLDHVPVLLQLKTDYIVGVLGTAQQTGELFCNIAMQLALTHSYDEVKLVLLADPEDAASFDFVRYLPHNWDNDRSIRFFVSSQTDALRVSEYLNGELEALQEQDKQKKALKKMPAYVILALSKKLFGCMEVLKDLLSEEEWCGVSILAAFDGIPKECSKIIDMGNEPKVIDLIHPEESEQPFSLDPYDKAAADKSMRIVMKTKLKMDSQSYLLPNTLTFLEMYGVGCVEHLNSLKRWKDNSPVNSLSAQVGIGTDGRPFTLDLHQKSQGPHGLVAGMTGSGKSEFLITYILSMAVNYSPDEVAFILIDYKGGGLADAFEDKERGIHLPHLVGTITNLDGASIQRSLMSIKSELLRRQRVFKEAKALRNEGTLDIYDYQRLYRNKKVLEPLPHLFIISDEFAELKQQQPDFMDELISAARIGRSLGVHLILATQKPGGVVNDQIWSNTKFRVCLRVQDRGDSMEMLKRPEAAELKQTGRFYLQVGYNEYFALGQSAWCGADYEPQDGPPVNQDNSVQFIDSTGQLILDVESDTEKKKAENKQLVAIVQYLSDLAKRENIQAKSLWTDPLPKEIELGAFLESTPAPETEDISALIGMADDPEKQCQFPFFLSLLDFHNMLLVGSSGSGKSTFLRTMLYSLIDRYSPEEVNYYLIDLSDGALSGYSHTPHCGAYLTQENDADIGRLLVFLKELIGRRKKLFAEAEISDFKVYRQMKPLPLILVIVDSFTNIKSLRSGEQYFVLFQDYLRDGASYGVRYILSCNHDNEAGAKSKQELDYRVALQAKDRYEYGDILDVRCTYAPPAVNGRGLCLQDGRPLEYHTAMLDCDRPEQERASLLRERLSRIMQRYGNCTLAERLPMADLEQSYEDFCTNFQMERIPLGYSMNDMKTVAVPFQQLHSMSLYFGNPKGIAAVFGNLLAAAQKNRMTVFVVRRQMVSKEGQPVKSVFDENVEGCASSAFQGDLTVLDCTREEIVKLSDFIMGEIKERNVYRDEYSIQQGIPLERKGRSQKAAKYIRAHSNPVFVVIESFADFCEACEDEEQGGESELEGLFSVYFNRMNGYNIYFAAGFYPDDTSLSRNPLMKLYNAEDFLLLFGGRYDKIPIPGIPYEVSKMDTLNPQYNRFWMKYRETFYPVIMPCGKLEGTIEDPDEERII